MKVSLFSILAIALIGSAVSGCTTADGRFRPIDPLGRAIFNMFDGGSGGDDNRYGQNYNQGGPDYNNRRAGSQVWIDGAYGRDSYGRTVWIPGHWYRG